jgi:nicotinamidase-related amidase
MTFQFIPGSPVEVPEINYKKEILLPAKTSVLLIVDMQNDFVKEGGSLVVPAAIETISHIRKLSLKARNAGSRIVYTKDTQVKNDPEFDIWPEHCLKGTWGWEIVDELKPGETDLICMKNRYDGFYGSWLNHFLSHVWSIKNLVIVGTVSNICVLHTAASAALRWFRVVVPARAISALTEFDQALTLHQVDSLYNGEIVKSIDHINFVS